MGNNSASVSVTGLTVALTSHDQLIRSSWYLGAVGREGGREGNNMIKLYFDSDYYWCHISFIRRAGLLQSSSKNKQ